MLQLSSYTDSAIQFRLGSKVRAGAFDFEQRYFDGNRGMPERTYDLVEIL